MVKSQFSIAFSVILALIASLFISVMQPQAAQASHYRGTFANVEYHAPSGSDAAEVHITATGLTAKNRNGGFGDVFVYRTDAGVPTLVNGCLGSLEGDKTSVEDNGNPLFEITTDTWTITDCFDVPGEYTFEASSCCRIDGIQNIDETLDFAGTIQFEAKISIDGVNDSSSPIYNAGYMYNIAYEVGLSYATNLGGLGQGNTTVTYELVTDQSGDLGGYGAFRVPCSDLNVTTGAYQINSAYCTADESISGAFGGAQKFYALKVRATDANGQYATRDVLLNFDTTTNRAPVFTSTPDAQEFTVTPDTTSTLQFCAQDPDNEIVGFTFSPTRAWITASDVTELDPATTPRTYCVSFTLAPPAGTAEAFNFEVSAFDSNSEFVRSASNIFSLQAGAEAPEPIVTNPEVINSEPYVWLGPAVKSISPSEIVVGTDKQVTITGKNIGGVTKFTVRGILITIKSNTRTEIVFEMPAQLLAGFADIVMETPQGTLSWFSALRFLPVSKAQSALPNTNSKAKQYISTFAGDKAVLTSKMFATISSWVRKLPQNAKITCQGSTSGSKVTAFDKRLASNRARNVCKEAIKNRSDLTYSIELNPSSSTKDSARHVWMIQN